jgi:NAD(P)H-flavin reductase
MVKRRKILSRNELYMPIQRELLEVRALTPVIKLFRMKKPKTIAYKPGQFLMVSVWGAGEVPISIASEYKTHKALEFCVMNAGSVTSVLHALKSGDTIYIRGPFGNGFQSEKAYGNDILIVAGGLGITRLRPLLDHVVHHKDRFGKIALIYGSRSPSEMLFMEDVHRWGEKGVDRTLTVEKWDNGWKYETGLATEHIGKQKINGNKTRAFICGPEALIEAAMKSLSQRGIADGNIITSIESHMKCGVGKCGHCYTDGKYVCTDGPVFSYEEIKKFGTAHP